METKHQAGYWVHQLSDNQIAELLEILVSKKKARKFVRVLQKTKAPDSITLLYEGKRLDTYYTYTEALVTLSDYKISGGHSYIDFYEYMIEHFGEEYADDFINYADNFIAENPEDKWSLRLAKVQKAIPAMLDSHSHTMHNDI